MYLNDLINLFGHIAAHVQVQQGGLGFSFGAPGQINADWGDVYYKLHVEDDPEIRYTLAPGATTTWRVAFYVLARYRKDEAEDRRIAEQTSICEAVGRLVLHHLRGASRCLDGFGVAAASGLTFKRQFGDDTVGVRFEVELEGPFAPPCQVLTPPEFDVCAFAV